jgi:hypothetical protein
VGGNAYYLDKVRTGSPSSTEPPPTTEPTPPPPETEPAPTPRPPRYRRGRRFR